MTVNGKGYGLYLDLEPYDDVSLAHLFPTTQHLHEANAYGVHVRPGEAGTYEIDEGDEDHRADIEALVTAANATGGGWSEGMAATTDLGEMTRMWAGEQYLGHWDGYSVRDSRSPPPPDAGGVLGATASSPHRVRPHRLTLRARRGERLRVTGVLRLPAGARCGGRVAVRVDARFRVPRRGSLTVRARFLGTSRLAPRSAAPRTLRPRARARSASRGGS